LAAHGRKLVIAGNTDLANSSVWSDVSGRNLEGNIIRLGFVSDDMLRRLYWGADIYIDPSLYEGFGFQVAEALACGAPVICSNTTSLPEIIGTCGITVPPLDVEALAHAINEVLDPTRNASLRQMGPVQAASFDWASSISQVYAEYALCLQ
jgi:glycosyltransferase involved in cell wall biosynthesis